MKTAASFALAAIASVASALPAGTSDQISGTIATRASTTDAPVGYASQNGGTTGGAGGTTTTVSSLAQFTAAVKATEPMVIFVKGTIKGNAQGRVASDKSILGLDSSSKLEGISLYIKDVSNVIVRNLAMSKVLADTGDAIGIQASQNVWIDHMDLSSDMSHDKDYYDGLCDVTHASEWVTISNTKFHDHWKSSLVGHSDSNADEDTGHLHVTYANNHWVNINSRAPSVRFGMAHIFNNYFDTIDTGVNTRMGAKVLIESTVFAGTRKAIQAADSDTKGTAEVKDVVLGGGSNDAPSGSFGSVPYKYTLLGSSKVKAAVVGVAGNTLKLS